MLIADTEQLEQISEHPNEKAKRLAQRFWPGPLTFVLPPSPPLFPEGLSTDGSIGVRVPNHPVALALLNEAGPNGCYLRQFVR